jgi:hypothetical protein
MSSIWNGKERCIRLASGAFPREEKNRKGGTDLIGLLIEEEVGPVRIGLHQAEVEELLEAESKDAGADLQVEMDQTNMRNTSR